MSIDEMAASLRARYDEMEQAIRRRLPMVAFGGEVIPDPELPRIGMHRAIVDELMSWRHEYNDPDPWWSCAQAVLPDDPEPGSGCLDESRAGLPCDCGLDARRGRVLRVLLGEFEGAP